jgi:hypothetical protein
VAVLFNCQIELIMQPAWNGKYFGEIFKIKEVNLEVADRIRQAFGNKVIRVTFNSHTTKKKADLLSHYSDSAAGSKYQRIVIAFPGETRGVSLWNSSLSPLWWGTKCYRTSLHVN